MRQGINEVNSVQAGGGRNTWLAELCAKSPWICPPQTLSLAVFCMSVPSVLAACIHVPSACSSPRQISWSIAWTDSHILEWPRDSRISLQKDSGDVGWWVWGLDIWNIKTGEPGIRGIPDTGFSQSIAGKGIEEYSLAGVCLLCVYVSICPPIMLISQWLAMCMNVLWDCRQPCYWQDRRTGIWSSYSLPSEKDFTWFLQDNGFSCINHYQEEGKEQRKLTSLYGNAAMKMSLFDTKYHLPSATSQTLRFHLAIWIGFV